MNLYPTYVNMEGCRGAVYGLLFSGVLLGLLALVAVVVLAAR